MKENLDYNQSDFKYLLDKSSELILKQYDNVQNIKGYHNYPQQEVESWFNETIPENGMDVNELLRFVENKVINTAVGNVGPHMYAYVMSGGNQMSIIGDKLASAINQNVAKWHLAPAITEIDKRIIQWSSELTGFGKNAGGFIGSSGSSANLDGLTVARNIYFEKLDIRKRGLFGIKPFTVYCSNETHSSIDKSIQLLGIGNDHLRKVDTHANYTINTKSLEIQIKKDRKAGFTPFCIVGNAGTVNTGAIDDLEALATLAKKYEMWFHIDGSYGGLVASLNSKKHLFKGIALADSLALDFHKWLYQPFEIGCLLVKDWDYMNRAYFKRATYLDKSLEDNKGRLEFNENHFLLSRNAKSLKAWMTIKAFGMKRIRAMMQKDIDLTTYLNNQINQSKDFELIADSDLAISCFRYKGELKKRDEVIQLNKDLISALEKDGRVFITGTILNNEFVLRACLINHRKTKKSTDYLLTVIRDVGQNLKNQKINN